MNALDTPSRRPNPRIWRRPELREILARRDIGALFRYLRRIGFSQQRIGAMTGQSQPEVSAIMHRRRVTSYPVLERIVDGLRIPRELAGLAYTVDPPAPAPPD
jgi:transcriptional regulator with XRE-family HTH domain